MKPINDNELFQALEELRPEPSPSFAAELDARVAAGFPRRSRVPSPAALLERLRGLKRRQMWIPAGGLATAMVIAVAVVLSQAGDPDGASKKRASSHESVADPETLSRTSGAAEPPALTPFAEEGATGVVLPSSDSAAALAGVKPFSASLEDRLSSKRAIERSSQLVLATEPERLGRASSEVFDVVHDHRGVVLRSRTSDGSAARAEAEFELLIPSGKLGDAMAAFSRIGAVRSRQEATADITAPTVSATERLEDSRARIDSLLGQLAAAGSEGERETVERELRSERSRAANLQASLDNLERRAALSRVSLRIVGGDGAAQADDGGAWGVGDALDDAGQVLGVAAAVTLLALAVLAPVALIALLIWLARRTYLRRARRTALG